MVVSREFQFTHPGGVRLTSSSRELKMAAVQFTHPGGVRRVRMVRCLARTSVSIHAPGRGATSSVSKAGGV